MGCLHSNLYVIMGFTEWPKTPEIILEKHGCTEKDELLREDSMLF